MDYDIKSLGRHCAGTGRPLVPGTVCHSVVVERLGHLTRLDFSDEGWKGPPPDALGEWVTIVPGDAAQPRPLDADTLLRHFEVLCEEANPTLEQDRYVLALLLLQRRRLRLEDTQVDDDGTRSLSFSGTRGEGPFEITDQSLTEEQISQLQAQIQSQLRSSMGEPAAGDDEATAA